MRTAIDRDHSKGVLLRRVHSVIEKCNRLRRGDDFSRRPHARKGFWSACKRWMLGALMVSQILNLRQQFRLIGRKVRAFHAPLQLLGLFLGLDRPLLLTLRVSCLAVRTHCALRNGVAPSRRSP